jgi:hypothetical protein
VDGAPHRGGLLGLKHRDGRAMTSSTKSPLARMPQAPQESPRTKAQEQRRPQASDRYLAGDPIEDSCRALAGAKSGLYTWRERSLATDPSWSAELRRRPRATPTKTPQRSAQVVVALRQTLAQHGPSWGAAALRQALAPQGIEPGPSPRTIYRMLHRDD